MSARFKSMRIPCCWLAPALCTCISASEAELNSNQFGERRDHAGQAWSYVQNVAQKKDRQKRPARKSAIKNIQD